ncbi:cell division control protein 73 [Ceratobasidium sp. AG-Ba]|nr:cell division control protein 73 [Ceratobasidium sp. AG-Ba]
MPPKGGNAKKESGRAKKAENEQKKQEAAAAAKEKKEAEDWAAGSKSNKSAEEKAAKKAAEAARKAENARLLAEEEASSAPKVKAAPKAGKGKAKAPPPKPAGPGAIAAGGGLGSVEPDKPQKQEEELVQSFAATGIDDALDLLDVVNAKTDKASVGQQAAGIERHPERRFKAALEAYQERELPRIRQERPGLRLQQYKEALFKEFQKSPDNPFNQTLASYDASKEERADALAKRKQELEDRLRQDE